MLLDFSNSTLNMFEKQHFVLEISILLPGFAFFTTGIIPVLTGIPVDVF